tara:strand:+ start:383 stop:487 length:105 start_codon:yes stop_codon:yes gene_type:complete
MNKTPEYVEQYIYNYKIVEKFRFLFVMSPAVPEL